MSRIRTIKPEFWTSPQVMECSPNARLLFIGMWNFCDDHGRHPASVKQLKALIFPADDISLDTIRGMFDELSSNDLISTYVVDNKEYFEVSGWRHQKIDKPQKPKFPAPSKPFADHSTNGSDGKEGIGEEGKKIPEANASGAADDPPKPVYSDARHELWGEGKRMLGELGIPVSKAGPLMGQWLKESGDDCPGVLDAIRRAREHKAVDPIAWIVRALPSSRKKNEPSSKGSISDAGLRLIRELDERAERDVRASDGGASGDHDVLLLSRFGGQ
jgi:hypothetical protein